MCPPIFPLPREFSDLEYSTLALSKLKGISICSLNIHSLVLKYDCISSLLSKTNIDCLCLNESYLNNSIMDEELAIPHYNLYRMDRTKESGKLSGGGLAIYVRDQYDFEIIEGSTACLPHIESTWLKLSLKNT